LRSFRAQIDDTRRVLDGANMGSEHHVELPRCGQFVAFRALQTQLGDLRRHVVESQVRALNAGLLEQVIESEPLVRLAIFDHGIVEALHMAGGLPYLGVHEDRRIDALHVFPVRHRAPPGLLDVAQQFDTQRTIVPAAIEATVDLGTLEDESLAFAQGDEFLHHI